MPNLPFHVKTQRSAATAPQDMTQYEEKKVETHRGSSAHPQPRCPPSVWDSCLPARGELISKTSHEGSKRRLAKSTHLRNETGICILALRLIIRVTRISSAQNHA